MSLPSRQSSLAQPKSLHNPEAQEKTKLGEEEMQLVHMCHAGERFTPVDCGSLEKVDSSRVKRFLLAHVSCLRRWRGWMTGGPGDRACEWRPSRVVARSKVTLKRFPRPRSETRVESLFFFDKGQRCAHLAGVGCGGGGGGGRLGRNVGLGVHVPWNSPRT